jgi:two-component system OmpR family response regulator
MTALHVLHVDDEPDICEVVEVSLCLDPNLVTRSCGSGPEAIAVAMNWPTDIILLDVMMPVMDGPTTLQRLRDSAQTASIPVVFMTARAQARELNGFHSLGAAGVILKPFDPMTLAASVRRYVQPTNDALDAPVDDFLQRVNSVFLRRANDDAAALAKHRCALKNDHTLPATLAAIRQIAHGLAGAGGIFDFPEISEAAAALEQAVIAQFDGSDTVKEITLAIDRLLARMETSRPLRKMPPS